MSKYQLATVACPACGHAQEAKLYVSINADRMLTATDRLIDGSFDLVECEECGQAYRLDHRMLYTDLPRRRWIVQHPWSDRERYAALEEEAARVFRVEYLEHPPDYVRAQAAFVEPRICFGRGELVEKLTLWQHDVDDRALESLKLVLFRNHLDQLFALGPCALQLTGLGEAGLTFLVVSLNSGTALDRLQVPAAELDRVAGDLDAFRPAFPDLFDHAYVNASRYLL